MNEKILIIEDDQKLRSGLLDNLAFEGYRASGTWNADLGAKVWREIHPDLVILDLMLPGKSGFRLLHDMRASADKTPVIILSARGEEWDKIKGFRLGCDDYVVKPFSIMELIERIRAVLRRFTPDEPVTKVLRIPGIELNLADRELTFNGKTVVLPERLFELMIHFMRNPERVISRKELLKEVWLMSPDVETRTVDVHVAALRRKLDECPYVIETVYNAGYRLKQS